MNEKVESFKNFVKTRPNLVHAVLDNKVTWQKLYEIWDLYGESHEIWEEYNKRNEISKSSNIDIGFADIISILKRIDLRTIQTNLSNIQKIISVAQSLINNKEEYGPPDRTRYQPRPYYKYFED